MTDLDLDEMFHLAIHASGKGDHERAIVLLKQGAERENSARFHYLLGAEHAEIGMIDRAIDDIKTALALDPLIAEAWFQLGLLYGMRDDKVSAIDAWSHLDTFPDKPHLIFFKNAIELYFENEVEAAILKMQKGIDMNSVNPVLNKDMNNLIQGWRATKQAAAELADEAESTNHLFLSAYTEKH